MCTVLGYDVNNTKGGIAGDSVRENRELTWGLVGLGQGKILETFDGSVSNNLMIIPLTR